MLLSGILECLFLMALTLSGERENGNLHVIFFIGFILSCCAFFTLVTLHTKKNIILFFRTITTLLLYLLGISISVSFALNMQYCVTNCKNNKMCQINNFFSLYRVCHFRIFMYNSCFFISCYNTLRNATLYF